MQQVGRSTRIVIGTIVNEPLQLLQLPERET